MVTEMATSLRAAIVKWAEFLQTWAIPWCTGDAPREDAGIYPGEMAAFLGLCEVAGIRSIAESGRGQHAYSTQILGEYADKTGVEVVSIDREPDPIRGAQVRERLKRYPQVRCLVGDAFDVLPDAMRGLRGPIALLVDGPKAYEANSLSLVASLLFDVAVVAHHSHLDLPWGRRFAKLFPGAFHYEALGLSAIQEWQAFKRWEREWVKGYETPDVSHGLLGRSLAASSLAMAVLQRTRRSAFALFQVRNGSLRHHPLWLWMKWSVHTSRLNT